MVDQRPSRHGKRVWLQAQETDAVFTVPQRWTDLYRPDAFEVVSAGRALFRPDDLVRLATLLREVGECVESGPPGDRHV